MVSVANPMVPQEYEASSSRIRPSSHLGLQRFDSADYFMEVPANKLRTENKLVRGDSEYNEDDDDEDDQSGWMACLSECPPQKATEASSSSQDLSCHEMTKDSFGSAVRTREGNRRRRASLDEAAAADPSTGLYVHAIESSCEVDDNAEFPVTLGRPQRRSRRALPDIQSDALMAVEAVSANPSLVEVQVLPDSNASRRRRAGLPDIQTDALKAVAAVATDDADKRSGLVLDNMDTYGNTNDQAPENENESAPAQDRQEPDCQPNSRRRRRPGIYIVETSSAYAKDLKKMLEDAPAQDR